MFKVCGYRGIIGSNWNNSVNCSSRSSNWNNSPLNLNSNNSARGVTDTEVYVLSRKLNSPLADSYTVSQNGKTHSDCQSGASNKLNVTGWKL